MIIDGHAHLGGEYRDLPAIIKTLDATGTDRVVLCPADTPRDRPMPLPDPPVKVPGKELSWLVNRFLRQATRIRGKQEHIEQGNKEVYEIAVASGGRVIQFYWADLRQKHIADDIRSKIRSWQIKGIKLHQSCHPFRIKSSVFAEVTEMAADEGIPVFIHPHSKQDVEELADFSGSLKTPLIVGHLIGLEIFISMKEKTGGNIFFDISCPPLISDERIYLAVKEFGAGRIVMGSDTPYGKNNTRHIIERVNHLKISQGEKEMILGGNLKNILRI
jgi:predicted TIM-barrel fold metal-dependent hydrolase